MSTAPPTTEHRPHGTAEGGGTQGGPARRRATARVLVAVVRTYQAARSGRPTGCRYVPTCSEYAVEAIDTHGAARGSVLAARRLARCTPWGGHGIDPVPDRSRP